MKYYYGFVLFFKKFEWAEAEAEEEEYCKVNNYDNF